MTDRFAEANLYEGDRHKGRRFATLWSKDTKAEIDGDVTFAAWFDELEPIEKLDLLSDAIFFLENEYELTLRCFNNPLLDVTKA